ncbi:MAG: UDP-N-acetylmuramoyl-L-alanine--D-glutamate ligase [Alicyclobacillus sp.]|nr:UDP-N-acetylmuramoyl-L-alanine--D-glutamate ligase [Alicyclobacillus sp.]
MGSGGRVLAGVVSLRVRRFGVADAGVTGKGRWAVRLRAGQAVLVVGMARSGVAAAQLLLRHGCRVTVNDLRTEPEDPAAAAELQALGARLVLGGHPLELLDEPPDFIVKNPGIPYRVPLLTEALRRGIPVYTEIEVASWLAQAPILAITGSNGKTTTTSLTAEILAAAGLQPVVAGNIGRALCAVVETVTSHQWLVLEVSSFQLMGVETFHPHVAALLNLYPAHLDYHGSFAAYAAAKARLFRKMGPEDTAVLNGDQEVVRNLAAGLGARVWWFSRRGPVEQGAFVRGDGLWLRTPAGEQMVLPVRALALPGVHNVENALAALALAAAAGAPPAVAAEVLARFRGVEHRLEFVGRWAGVSYFNDSKSTNPTAALQALQAFPGPLVWIAGGLDRGDDFAPLVPALRDRVKAAVLLGQTAERLAEVCHSAGVARVAQAGSLGEAVWQAARWATAGDVVLLSPACASWDMFPSFEERGRLFKEAVARLGAGRTPE